MATQTFEFTGAVKLVYNENSPEFQQALEGFREVITGDKDTTAQQMLEHVASRLSHWGDHRDMIEGVGFVALVDAKKPERNDSGIRVENTYDERHFD